MKKQSKKQSNEENFEVYEVKKSGRLKKLDIKLKDLRNYLNPQRVLITIRYDFDTIFIWKGSESPKSKSFNVTLDLITTRLQQNLIHSRQNRTLLYQPFFQSNQNIGYIGQKGNILQDFKALSGVVPLLTDEEIMLLDLESEEGEKLLNQYHDETGNIAIRKGKATKYFIKWLKGETRRQIEIQKSREFGESYKIARVSEPEFKVIPKRGDNDDDRYPYPYIFKPPSPPDDLALAPRTQLRKPLKKKDTEDEYYCQYCGMKLTKEEQLTHFCKTKPKEE